MTLNERLWKTFNKALGQFQLIDEDDKILVGLSGGKDSLCLLEFLARRSKIHVPHFTVEALHVRMENIHYETDTTYLQSFCNSLGVPLHVITTSFDPSPRKTDSSKDNRSVELHSSLITHHSSLKEKPACFLCSWQRRKQLFNLAQELGCTKIALGHHQDDIIHTALMNLTFQGHFSTMPVKLSMRKMPLTIIRPLCLCQEADIRAYAELQGYEKQLKQCPYEHDTNRTTAADLFARMQQLNSEARYCIWRALEADKKLVEY
jgi:tRNA(Ile)-lysidine synthase TilS/MesJ